PLMSALLPYTTLFRSDAHRASARSRDGADLCGDLWKHHGAHQPQAALTHHACAELYRRHSLRLGIPDARLSKGACVGAHRTLVGDRKSTRLNSSHVKI